jgi:uncharacterized SAM-binding protein YcdF (DUF218 family)
MLFLLAILALTLLGLAVACIAAWGAPIWAIPLVLAAIAAAGLALRQRRVTTAPVVHELESIEFTEDDYRTLVRGPEHTHGHVKRGPKRIGQ